MNELKQLDARRREVAGMIQQAVAGILGGDSAPRRRGRPAGSKNTAASKGARKGRRRKMSAAARKAISDAQKRRWAAARKKTNG